MDHLTQSRNKCSNPSHKGGFPGRPRATARNESKECALIEADRHLVMDPPLNCGILAHCLATGRMTESRKRNVEFPTRSVSSMGST